MSFEILTSELLVEFTLRVKIIEIICPNNYSLTNIQKQDPEIRLYFQVEYQ